MIGGNVKQVPKGTQRGVERCARCGREQPCLWSPCEDCSGKPLPTRSACLADHAAAASGDALSTSAHPAGAPMLDPDWSQARGYSHAAGLLEIVNRTTNERGTK